MLGATLILAATLTGRLIADDVAVPGIDVALTSACLSVRLVATTSADGSFTFTGLQPGCRYRVTPVMDGWHVQHGQRRVYAVTTAADTIVTEVTMEADRSPCAAGLWIEPFTFRVPFPDRADPRTCGP